MEIIELVDFMGYNFKEVYCEIMPQKEDVYEVRVDKVYMYPDDAMDQANFFNYCIAAYVGQKLYEVSEQFTYSVPRADYVDDFIFRVKIRDREEFIDVLSYIVSGYHYWGDGGLHDKFENAATKMFDEACFDENYIACWGLIMAAHTYHLKLEHDHPASAAI